MSNKSFSHTYNVRIIRPAPSVDHVSTVSYENNQLDEDLTVWIYNNSTNDVLLGLKGTVLEFIPKRYVYTRNGQSVTTFKKKVVHGSNTTVEVLPSRVNVSLSNGQSKFFNLSQIFYEDVTLNAVVENGVKRIDIAQINSISDPSNCTFNATVYNPITKKFTNKKVYIYEVQAFNPGFSAYNLDIQKCLNDYYGSRDESGPSYTPGSPEPYIPSSPEQEYVFDTVEAPEQYMDTNTEGQQVTTFKDTERTGGGIDEDFVAKLKKSVTTDATNTLKKFTTWSKIKPALDTQIVQKHKNKNTSIFTNPSTITTLVNNIVKFLEEVGVTGESDVVRGRVVSNIKNHIGIIYSMLYKLYFEEEFETFDSWVKTLGNKAKLPSDINATLEQVSEFLGPDKDDKIVESNYKPSDAKPVRSGPNEPKSVKVSPFRNPINIPEGSVLLWNRDRLEMISEFNEAEPVKVSVTRNSLKELHNNDPFYDLRASKDLPFIVKSTYETFGKDSHEYKFTTLLLKHLLSYIKLHENDDDRREIIEGTVAEIKAKGRLSEVDKIILDYIWDLKHIPYDTLSDSIGTQVSSVSKSIDDKIREKRIESAKTIDRSKAFFAELTNELNKHSSDMAIRVILEHINDLDSIQVNSMPQGLQERIKALLQAISELFKKMESDYNKSLLKLETLRERRAEEYANYQDDNVPPTAGDDEDEDEEDESDEEVEAEGPDAPTRFNPPRESITQDFKDFIESKKVYDGESGPVLVKPKREHASKRKRDVVQLEKSLDKMKLSNYRHSRTQDKTNNVRAPRTPSLFIPKRKKVSVASEVDPRNKGKARQEDSDSMDIDSDTNGDDTDKEEQDNINRVQYVSKRDFEDRDRNGGPSRTR